MAKTIEAEQTKVTAPVKPAAEVSGLPALPKFVGSTNLATIPEHLRNAVGSNKGLEDIGRDDVLIPRLCIAQSLSPQLKKTNEAYIEGLEVGDLFNSVTGEIYGTEVVVVPLFFFKQFIEFKPIKEGGGVVAMYPNQASVPAEKLQFTDGNSPLVTEFKNEMCLLVRENEPMVPLVVSFKSTGLKTARKWNSLMRSNNGLPAYSKFYTLEVGHRTKGSQEWEGLNVLPGEFVPAEFFAAAEAYFTQLQASGVQVDTSGMGEEAQQGSGSTEF